MNKYDIDWYNQIEEWVFEYQRGSTDAGEKLIESFQPYFNKYIKLLIYGRIDFNDKDTRNFINMFIDDKKIRGLLKKKRQSHIVRGEAMKAVGKIQSSCKWISEEDLKQELICILLKMANRYEKRNRNFVGYLYSSFRFELRRALQSLTDDVLTSGFFSHFPYFDEEGMGEEDQINDDDKANLITIQSDEDMDHNWVYGLTTSKFFSKFSVLDRLILKMYYIDQYNDIEISERTGFHRNTINSRRRAARKLIEEEFGIEG